MDKQNVIFPYNGYYSTTKSSEVWTSGAMWVNLENIKEKEARHKVSHLI